MAMTAVSDTEEAASGSALLERHARGIGAAADFRRRRGVCATPLALAVALLVTGVATLGFGASQRRRLRYRSVAGLELQHSEVEGSCGPIDTDVDYDCPKLPYNIAEIKDAEACCSLCEQDPKCGAWTWEHKNRTFALSNVCILKVLSRGAKFTKVPRSGVVSGLPAKRVRRAHKHEARTANNEEMPESLAVSKQVSKTHDQRGPLFCFTLIVPNSHEVGLLELQHRHHSCIFACDEHAIYSNESIKVVEGIYTKTLKGSLKAVRGGESSTPLNIDIFMTLWWKVITDGQFMHHDWTVKVDPDAVFLPQRLRAVLRRYSDGPNGVYLNNCKLGLRGGLEVFSRRAVVSWAEGSAKCLRHFEHQCRGPCLWGEDRFIDQCLWKVLNVKRENVSNMLADADCNPPQDWMACTDSSRVAYHPFQDVGSFTQCLFSSVS